MSGDTIKAIVFLLLSLLALLWLAVWALEAYARYLKRRLAHATAKLDELILERATTELRVERLVGDIIEQMRRASE